jgi:GT2 family glycosyltransferase
MISIIIINYNTFKLTAECVRSVQSKTKCEYEIILVDNASTECDPEKFVTLFPDIKLVKSDINLGFSKGNNLGIKAASGDYILLLNSDTLLINNAIDMALDKIKSDNTIGALSVQLVSPDGSLQQCSHYWSELIKLAGCTLKLHHIFPYFRQKQPDLSVAHYAEYLYGTFFLFPERVLEYFKERKLPETFFMYGEDTEWCYYIRKAGYKLYYLPDAKILHYGGASAGKNAREAMKDFEKEFVLHLIIKGKLYTVLYYITLAFFYFSYFSHESFKRGKNVLGYLIRNIEMKVDRCEV